MATIFEINIIELWGVKLDQKWVSGLYNSWMLQIDPRVSISCSARSLLRLQMDVPTLGETCFYWNHILCTTIMVVPCCSVMLFLYCQCAHCIGIQPSIPRPKSEWKRSIPFCRLWKWFESKSCVRKNRVRICSNVSKSKLMAESLQLLGAYGGRTCCPPPSFF